MKIININYKVWIFSLLLALPFVACNLDEDHPSDVTTDFLYNTAEGLQAAVNGLYTIERAIMGEGEDQSNVFANIMGDGGTDIDFNRASQANMSRYRTDLDLTTQGPPKAWWNMWYRVVERTNSIIAFGEEAGLETEDKESILREAYVYRAYAHFWLVRKYDNIWLNIEPTTFENTDGRTFAPASQEDVYKQIVLDLDKAIEYYGDDWSDVPGRFNLGVAKLLRADVAMWQKDYTTAATQTEDIINKGPFALESPDKVFTKDGRNITKESMFVMQFDEFAPGGGQFHRLPMIFTAEYRSIPGCIMADEFGGYGWARIFPNPYLISLYDSKNDKRYNSWWQHHYTYNDPDYDFSKTKYQLGDTLKYNDNSSLKGDNYYKRANIGCKKYWDWDQQAPNITKHWNNIYIFRYPHVLLLAAEANMRLNNDVKALSFINQIRANRISSNAPDQLLTVLNEDIYLEEFAREMAFEGHRWFLLKRTGKLVERVRLHGGISEFRGVKAPNALYFSARTNIKDYHATWPIPQSARDAMGGFPQNPGYNE